MSTPAPLEALGSAVGALLAPLFALTSKLRHARTFHPRGDLAEATVEPHPSVEPRDRALALVLRGHALVRFSDALSKGMARWPDVLGCAIRFGPELDHAAGAQDLLFATIRRPWTMPLAPFFTRVRDYLANDYFAVSPFDAPDHPAVYFCLRPLGPSSPQQTSTAEPTSPATRADRRRRALARAMSDGRAGLDLCLSERPLGPFRPFARITLRCLAEDRPAALHFDPFASGRGIAPRGFVQAMRRSVYAASQAGRAASGEETGGNDTAVFRPPVRAG